ncbi:MAG: (d)CMP kinase, partial [Gammaproteobacteria bacterium]
GTICRALAKKLGWHLLDSGALYRLVSLAADRRAIELDDVAGVAALARNLDAEFGVDADGEELIILSGDEVSREIRTEGCGMRASRVAQIPEVRSALTSRQRAYRQPPGLVADGRDMGSVIFPDAQAKIFLTASSAERAERRHKQLFEKGIDANLDQLYREIAERDKRDAERAVAPLRACDDAKYIDTTGMSIPEVVGEVLDYVGDCV